MRIRAPRTLILAAAFSLMMGSSALAQAYDGDWEGTLAVPSGQKLRLELHVKTAGADTSAELVSLDQGNAVIPSTAAKVENGELQALYMAIGGELKGKLSADGKTIDATWTQNAAMPLTFTRKAK